MAQQMLLDLTPRPSGSVKRKRRVSNGRTSYSLATKLRAVEEAEKNGLKAAAAALGLDERVVRQWIVRADVLRLAGLTNAGSTRRIRPRSSNDRYSPTDLEVFFIPLPKSPKFLSETAVAAAAIFVVIVVSRGAS